MTKIFCNLCGKEFDEYDEQEHIGMHHVLGYPSKFDGDQIDLDLCVECYDKLLKYIVENGKINPITKSI